jgi:tetratricopeptide (TPR) repeat protein
MTRQEKYQEQKAACLKRFRGNNKPGKTLVLFLHHGEFCELLTEPIENRIDFIIANKDETEIATRLKWMQPVIPNTLSPKCRKALTRCAKALAECHKAQAKGVKGWAKYNNALAEYDKARAECYKAWDKHNKARAEYDKARAEYDKALAEFDKVRAKYVGARAEYDKAQAEYVKAGAEFTKLYEPVFMAEHPDCPWNGKTLFP